MVDNSRLRVELEANTAKFESAMRRAVSTGTITARELETRVSRMNNLMAQNSRKAQSAIGGVMNVSRQGRFVLQNTANQIGDVAVQLEQGTNVFRVAGQQLPQIAGGFAALGGSIGLIVPIIGTLLAVGLPVAGMLFSMGDAQDEVAQKAGTFAERTAAARSAIEKMAASAATASGGDLRNLLETYGEITDEVGNMLERLAEIDKRGAQNKVSGLVSEISEAISGVLQANTSTVDVAVAASGTAEGIEEARLYREEIDRVAASIERRKAAGFIVDQAEIALLGEMQQELAALEGQTANLGTLLSEMQLSPDVTLGLSDALAELEAASSAADFQGVADQFQIIHHLLEQSGVASKELLDNISNSEDTTRKMSAKLEAAEEAASGISAANVAGTIGAGADEAARLAVNLGISLQSAQRIAALGPQGVVEPGTEVGRSGAVDPRTVGGRAIDRQTADAQVFLDNYTPPRPQTGGARSSGRSGGGGGRSSSRAQPDLFAIAEGELAKLQQQIDLLGKSKAEIAELTTKHKLLEEAKKRGITITDAMNARIEAEAAQVGQLAQQYELASDQMSALENIQKSLKDSILDFASSGSDALDGFAQSIKRAALEYALFGTGQFADIAGGGGGGGGLLGGVLGGLFGGFRANGGGVGAGRAYVVNENTPNSEVFVPSQNGAVLNVPQAQAALRGQGGTIVLDVRSDSSAIVQIVENTTGAMIQQNNQMQDDGFNHRSAVSGQDPRRRGPQ